MRILAKGIVVVLNVIALLIVVTAYYLIFDLHWSISSKAVTLGLPLLLGSIGIIIAIYYVIKHQKTRFGVYSLAGTVIIIIYTCALSLFFPGALLPEQLISFDETQLNEDDLLIADVLEAYCSEFNGYTIVQTETAEIKRSNAEKLKNNIVTNLHNTEYDFSDLAENLIDNNQNTEYLNIPSSLSDGYYIDYDRHFARYFEEGGGGWTVFQLSHPAAHSITSISIPAYDKQSGYALALISNTYGDMGGKGYIYVFEYQDGSLVIRDKLLIWMA